MSTYTKGQLGEAFALEFLQAKGYFLLEKNYRCLFGEVDMVMRHTNGQKREIVFIEVKARSSSAFGMPSDAVNRQKLMRIVRSAQFYLKEQPVGKRDNRYRIDVVSVMVGNLGTLKSIEHFQSVTSEMAI